MLTVCDRDVPLATYNTFGIGGPAAYLIEVTSEEVLQAVLQEARKAQIPVTILGGGSNVLIPDEGIAGCVIVNRMKGISYTVVGDVVTCIVASGEMLDDFVASSVEHGYWGVENLSHIPGTVGATPVQNVGAYGVEVSSLIQEVRAVNIRTGEEKNFSNAECGFGYRNSYFKTAVGKNWMILSVIFILSTQQRANIEYADLQKYFAESIVPTQQEIRKAIIEIRSRKFPNWNIVGTAGSFFKNPTISIDHYQSLKLEYPELPCYPVNEESVKVPLGWVLDKICNLKGVEVGLVSSYKEQALVVVAQKGATAHEVKNFSTMIMEKVFLKTGISIESEVTFL